MRHRGGVLSLCLALSICATWVAAIAGDEESTVPPLDEVVVTAQKRPQLLQDVPVSVDVVNGNQLSLQDITTITDLSRAVPALSDGGAIRGISTNGFTHSSESAVAVVLDGVDMGVTQISDLFDVKSVEVLSGPQGMLFGKNASGGVINIETNAPDLTAFQAEADVETGNFDHQRDRLLVNVPLSSTAGLRVVGHFDQSGHYLKDTFTDTWNRNYDFGGRARFLWKPSDALKVNFIADWDKADADGIGAGAAFGIVRTPALATSLAACGIVANLHNNLQCSDGLASLPLRSLKYGLSGQVDYLLPSDYLLTSITANRWRRNGSWTYKGFGSDTDLLSTNILNSNYAPESDDLFSQELRVTSPVDQAVEFVAGLYYSIWTTDLIGVQGGTLGLVPPPLQIGRVWGTSVYQTSKAIYGQATIHASKKLSFIAGGRYTSEYLRDDTREFTDTTTPNVASWGFIYSPFFSIANAYGVVRTDNFSWRMGPEYHFTKNVMTYLTASRGYKGPAVNDVASPPLTNAIIRPEIPMYYELGAKGVFFDSRLLLTAALFSNDVRNFQTAVFTPPTAANPVPGFAQGNAPYIRSRGVEVDFSARPLDDLTFNGGIIYDRAFYASSFLVACAPEQAAGIGNCSSFGTTEPVRQLAGLPKWRIPLNGEYQRVIPGGYTAFVQSDLVFESGYDLSPSPDPITVMPAQWMLGARIGIRAKDGRWDVSVYGRNLLGKTYPILTGDPLSAFDGGEGKSYWVSPTTDWYRTYGVTLDVRF